MLVFLKQLEIEVERHGVSMCFAVSLVCRGCLPKITKMSISESGIIYIPEEFERTLMDFGSPKPSGKEDS